MATQDSVNPGVYPEENGAEMIFEKLIQGSTFNVQGKSIRVPD
jgi:hypothetical protein